MKAGRDYYWDNGRMVLTEEFLRRRGTCCGNGCRHCPYGKAPTRAEGDGGPPALKRPPESNDESCSSE